MEILELFRGSERVLIILAGAMSILLGWNLFRVGVVDPQSGVIEGTGWKVSLQRVGPGVFFALFGAIVLLNGQLAVLSGEPPAPAGKESDASKQSGQYIYNASAGDVLFRDTSQAINTIALIDPGELDLPNPQKIAIEKARSQLLHFQSIILARNSGTAEDIQLFKDHQLDPGSHPIPDEKSKKIELIRIWLEKDFLDAQ